MTARTHDLAAFTSLTVTFYTLPLTVMSPATFITLIFANMLGGLFPDLDESTARFWHNLRGGSVLGKLIAPLLGGHRLITHSLLGLIVIGLLLSKLLDLISPVLLVDMHLVWWAFMMGFISHLLMDMFTKEGIPLLFPLPFNFGLPPFRFLRLKTGGLIEKSLIFPSLLFINAYLVWHSYTKLLDFLRLYLK